jgi:nitroreductase
VDVLEAIYGMRATRIYHDKPIPEYELTRILQAATRACSAGNTQPWEFVLVTDKETKQKLKAIMTKAFEPIAAKRSQKPEELIDNAGRPVTGHAAIENMDRVAAIVLAFWNPDRGIRLKGEYEENADGTLTQTGGFQNGRGSSVYPACQNMMLAAQAQGISSLFTTFFGLAEQEVKALLHVPRRMFLEAGIFLGYGAEELNRPIRKRLADVVHLNDWDGKYEPHPDAVIRLPGA